jgi:two-component sensor histidine kinase
MSDSMGYEVVGQAEADHRIANNLASLSGVVRLQRNAISKGGKDLTAVQVCTVLDDIRARIEVMAKLHKSLAVSANGNGVNLGDFLQEISELIGTLALQLPFSEMSALCGGLVGSAPE